jgi:hypothetical protein
LFDHDSDGDARGGSGQGEQEKGDLRELRRAWQRMVDTYVIYAFEK